mgnify:CR=1 FL=1
MTELWTWRRMERVKWTEKIRNEAVLERVDEGPVMLKLIRKRERKKKERNWLGHCLRKKLPAEGCTRRNDARENGLGQKKISDNR